MLAYGFATVVDDFYPYPRDWMNEARRSEVRELVDQRMDFWIKTKLLDKIIRAWVKEEILQESIHGDFINSGNNLDDQNLKRDIASLSLDERLNLEKQLYHSWSEFHWGDTIHSYFLDNKSDYDQASVRVLLFKDKGLAVEVYHQLRAQELTFETAYSLYSEDVPSSKRGLFDSTTVNQLPFGLNRLIPRLMPNEITSPLKISKKYAIINLLSFMPAKFDQKTKASILSKKLNTWVGCTTEYIKTFL